VLNKDEGSNMITKCPKCKTEFENKRNWGIKKFCSRKCANSKERPQEVRDKISKKLIGRTTARKGIKIVGQAKEQWLQKVRATRAAVPFDDLGWDTKRLRVIKDQNGKCNRCDINNWLGEKLSLEVDHIDGDGNNNDRNNLEGLCPNCHSLTKTWRGRNINDGKRVTNEELLVALNETKNIHQALIKVGMSPRGANYIRAKEILNGCVVFNG
jgi:endogenous inhibitor of DNA gyrase (YacG/DUF329 family)